VDGGERDCTSIHLLASHASFLTYDIKRRNGDNENNAGEEISKMTALGIDAAVASGRK